MRSWWERYVGMVVMNVILVGVVCPKSRRRRDDAGPASRPCPAIAMLVVVVGDQHEWIGMEGREAANGRWETLSLLPGTAIQRHTRPTASVPGRT
ncbi:hypothetical protein BJV78DRAFT_1265311 [Lactifluus subvellereus]|nr:hypothetical protein BJV78DRAFT_1265311 [Lactifluus subvellereus]